MEKQVVKFKELFDMSASQDQLKNLTSRLADLVTKNEVKELQIRMHDYQTLEEAFKQKLVSQERFDQTDKQLYEKAEKDEL